MGTFSSSRSRIPIRVTRCVLKSSHVLCPLPGLRRANRVLKRRMILADVSVRGRTLRRDAPGLADEFHPLDAPPPAGGGQLGAVQVFESEQEGA